MRSMVRVYRSRDIETHYVSLQTGRERLLPFDPMQDPFYLLTV